MNNIQYFECSCNSPEHTLRFVIDDSDDDKELYTEVHLTEVNSFFKRCWIALKYIFGYKCKYGNWDCWLLKTEDITKLEELLAYIKK